MFHLLGEICGPNKLNEKAQLNKASDPSPMFFVALKNAGS